jgi:Sec-independent protein translocase protein TatA
MTIIVIFAAIVIIGGFIYLKTSEKNTAETISNILEGAKEVQAEAQAEVEKAAKPKKKSAPRKKKETASATEGPIKGDYYKQSR